MKALDAKQKIGHIFWLLLFIASISLSAIGFAVGNFLLFVIFKSLFVPLLSFMVYWKWERPLSKNYYLLQLALLCAWVGDVLLSFSKSHPLFFILGACSFLIQHNFYIWLHLSNREKKRFIWETPFWGLPNLGYIVLFSIIYFAEINLILRSVCMIYAFFLGTSFLTAFHREMMNKRKYWLVVIGFGIFVLSDVLISIDSFLYPFSEVGGTSILFTYYIAQSLICLGNFPEPSQS